MRLTEEQQEIVQLIKESDIKLWEMSEIIVEAYKDSIKDEYNYIDLDYIERHPEELELYLAARRIL